MTHPMLAVTRRAPCDGPIDVRRGRPGLRLIGSSGTTAGESRCPQRPTISGLALARRIAQNQRQTAAAAETAALSRDIDEDRAALDQIMKRLDVRPKMVRRAVAVIGERAARLKTNGALLSRSPLSDVLEFEGMQVGVEGKAAAWKTLRRLANSDSRLDASQLDGLIARAHDQSETLERLRLQAVDGALRAR